MELNGDILIGAPRERVWQGLNDPDVLLASIPGGEEVRQLSATETHVRVLIKMGPVRARFVGKILMSDVRPGEACTLNFEGSGGAAGFASGRSNVTLSDEGEGTRLRYTASASVGGKLGQIGGRMIDASAKQTADQFFEAFSAQLDTADHSDVSGAASAATAPRDDGAAAAAMPASPVGAELPASTRATPSPAAAPAEFVPRTAAAPARTKAAAESPAGVMGEAVRVLWFALGAVATASGFWLANVLGR